MQTETFELIDKAVEGNKTALEALILGVEDMIFNLSLRMLGSPHDAQDASQEIIVKVITQLGSFRKESAFSTWVYRITINYLINYKKSMFAQHPLSFEYYSKDIDRGFAPNTSELMQNVDENILADELKQSCTNVMLQCLDPESRCLYVLGVMFKIDSKIGAELFDTTPEAYRQRLSRIRKKVEAFLVDYCGLSQSGKCNCKKRVGYAIQTHRLDPHNLEYHNLEQAEQHSFTQAMEAMDELSLVFSELPKYHAPRETRAFLNKLLLSDCMKSIKKETQYGKKTS